MNRSRNHSLRHMAAALLLCTGLASCSQDDMPQTGGTPLPDGKYPLAFTASVDGMATRSTGKDGWAEGDKIGVRIGADGATGCYELNHEDGTVKKVHTPVYWQNTAPATVTAWYPYEAQTDKDITNQSEGYKDIDFLKATAENKKFYDKVELSFIHQMAKVSYTLKKGDDITDEDLKGATVQIAGYTKASFSEGTLTGTDNGWITPASDNDALLVPKDMTGRPFIKVSINGYDFIYTPGEGAANLQSGTHYSYTITVKAEGITDVSVNSNIDWNTGGVSGSGSVTLPDYVIVPGEGQQGKELILKDGEVVDINGNGQTVSDNFRFEIPEGATATVNLNNVHIKSYGQYQAGINIEGGGTVILKLNGTENSIENFTYGITYLYGEGSHIHIEGPGTLKMERCLCYPLVTTKSIKITQATLHFNYTQSRSYYTTACIGSEYNDTCGDITIIKSDIHINIESPSGKYKQFGAAIGCGGGKEDGTEGGVCGNIDITLSEGVSKEEFLNRINVLKEDGSALLNDDQKVGKGLYGKSCGTVTWRNSNGEIIE